MDVRTLTLEDVLSIHELLVAESVDAQDPISPPGLRSAALLESAVGRQHTGFGPLLKYRTPFENAATLVFGLCNDHPFFNGNKRTALLAMLVHLDRNRLALTGVDKRELYEVMIAIASMGMAARNGSSKNGSSRRNAADTEVDATAKWLRMHTHAIRRKDRALTLRELERVLERFGLGLAQTEPGTINVEHQSIRRRPPLFRRVRETRVIDTFPERGERDPVSADVVKRLREHCDVSVEEFYGPAAVFDTFVNQYRSVLRRLSRT